MFAGLPESLRAEEGRPDKQLLNIRELAEKLYLNVSLPGSSSLCATFCFFARVVEVTYLGKTRLQFSFKIMLRDNANVSLPRSLLCAKFFFGRVVGVTYLGKTRLQASFKIMLRD